MLIAERHSELAMETKGASMDDQTKEILAKSQSNWNSFEQERRVWRTPTIDPIQRSGKLAARDVFAIFKSRPDRQPFPSDITLDSMIDFLKVYWPEVDPDYPEPRRLAAMKLDELLEYNPEGGPTDGDYGFFKDAPMNFILRSGPEAQQDLEGGSTSDD